MELEEKLFGTGYRDLRDAIFGAVDEALGEIMDPVEQELGGNHNWKFIRSRILSALGERGLRGKIDAIFGAAEGAK